MSPGVAPRRRLSDTDTLDSRVARLEAHWEDLMLRLDRQFAELVATDARQAMLIEKLDARADTADHERDEIRNELRLFITRIVTVVVVIVGIGETFLTLFGPAIRQALGLPQT